MHPALTVALLLLLLLPNCALALPQLLNPLTAITAPNATRSTFASPPVGNFPVNCIKGRIFRTVKRPWLAECQVAIWYLERPLHTNIRGKFHSGTSGSDLDPNFRLPRTQTYGSCRVEVEMAEKFVTEMTTWAVVTGGAYRLNVECRSRSFDGDKTGGWLLVGPNQRIKVSLLPSERAKVGADEGGSGVRFGR